MSHRHNDQSPTLTVSELLAKLHGMIDTGEIGPTDIVVTEGCDCEGDAGGVVVDMQGKTRRVMIERTKYVDPDADPRPGMAAASKLGNVVRGKIT